MLSLGPPLLLLLLTEGTHQLVSATRAPAQAHALAPARAPYPYPPAALALRQKEIYKQHRQRQRRDVIDDFIRNIDPGLRDDIQQGIFQNYFSGIPEDSSAISRALGIDDLTNVGPLEILNVPGYANYSTQTQTWSNRFHGQVHRLPYYTISQDKQIELAEIFLPDVDFNSLTPQEQENARNLTAEIFGAPQEGVEINMIVRWAGENNGGGQNNGQGNGGNWEMRFPFPTLTDSRGEFDGFVELESGLPSGDVEGGVVAMPDVWTEGEPTGNSTAYLVPNRGITILSDIDDILRVTKIYNPQEGLLNTFAREFTPWMNMPEAFARWSQQQSPSSNNGGNSGDSTNPGDGGPSVQTSPYHFHYLTTTPEQATQPYMSFIYNHYPLGSFDTRPLNFTTIEQTFSIRRHLLEKIFTTFPERKFVLVGDTTNSDVLKEYPALVGAFPGQVHCILIRNVSATEPENRLPYDLSAFEGLKREVYMFFNTPDDLMGLDFYQGDCVNRSVSQTSVIEGGFGWRNLPLSGEGGGDFGGIFGGGNDRGAAGRVAVEHLSFLVATVMITMAMVL